MVQEGKEKNTILNIQNLSNRYEGAPLLQDINFSLEQGDILCLLGPSGSGKTTLLRLLAGLEKEESGEIFFGGKEIRSTPPHKRNFGMMFQEYALFPHKTVYQNIAFGLEMQQCSPEEQIKRVQEMLDLVGLSGFDNRKIDELSGGERQRVALARSLAPKPQLLLLDEPLGSLDRTLRDRLTIEIRTILNSLGVTAIFVTHDQAEAFSIADKIAVLHDGILQQLDAPEALYRNPQNESVAKFLGFTNFIEGTLDEQGTFHSPLGPLQIANLIKRKKHSATLLIRPEGAQIPHSESVAENMNQLSGIITERRFQGSIYRVKIQVDTHYLSFDFPLDPSPPQIGQTIRIALKSSAMVLLGS